jgi:hypothetical protein
MARKQATKAIDLPTEATFREYSDLARDYARRIVKEGLKVSLLTKRSAKIDKSGGAGFISVILHLEPATRFEGLGLSFQSCQWATPGCIKACLRYGGRMRFSDSMFARLWRSWLLADHPEKFFALLVKEIAREKNRARKKGLGFTVRLNGTSDLEWEAMKYQGVTLFEIFPEVQWYDYTKSPDRPLAVKIPNYHLVYSHNERSDEAREVEILKAGGSVAMVFDLRKGKEMPKEFTIGAHTFPVIDGDITDLRHTDPKGVIVGLKYKLAFSKRTKKAIKPPAGFVVSVIGRVNSVRA